RLNSVIITFSGFKSGTCQRYSGRVNVYKKSAVDRRRRLGNVMSKRAAVIDSLSNSTRYSVYRESV
ncbi:hypothetical protein, partial [Salmonella enterica]|uniref:hypothetical protein n=1 Tax=Salmonella enterica TaxID=28901 RepID=UPI001C1FFCCC